MYTLDMMSNPMITTRLEPYKTVHSKPINTAADLSKLVIQNLIKPYIQNQITNRPMLTFCKAITHHCEYRKAIQRKGLDSFFTSIARAREASINDRGFYTL